jgi:hypothetical protein
MFALSIAGYAFAQGKDTAWRDQGIINVDKSPYAKLHNIPVHAVTIRDGFWAARSLAIRAA